MLSPKTPLATFSKRLLAFNVDMTVFLFTVLPLSLGIESDLGFMLLLFVMICFYHAAMESSAWQSTLGKKYLGIKVTDHRGGRISFLQGLARILGKFLSLMLFFGGFFMIYLRKDRRGLHDVLSKTYIIVG